MIQNITIPMCAFTDHKVGVEHFGDARQERIDDDDVVVASPVGSGERRNVVLRRVP